MVDTPAVPRRPKAPEPVAVSGSTDRQIGEIVATLRAQHDDIGEIKDAIFSINQQQRESTHDRRNQQQVIQTRLDTLERTQTEQARTQAERHQANTDALTKLASELTKLQDPVSDYVSLRKRAATFVMVLGGIGGVIWTLAEPIYSFFVSKIFGH